MRALVLGARGQDGSYLTEQLQADGVDVWGMTRRPRDAGPRMLVGDLLDQPSLEAALRACRPDAVFNLAAVTAPGGNWGTPQPPLLAEVTGMGVVRLLEAMLAATPNARLVHASSSAVGDPHRYGLYGAAKRFAHDAVVGYRARLHCSNAIFYSHTSPRADPRFLAPRICRAVARAEQLTLGDVDSRRDWGAAPDYCEALRYIHGAEPGDWMVSTGEQHTVRDMLDAALAEAGRDWEDVVTIDPQLPRVPHEQPGGWRSVRELGWAPRTGFAEMVAEMVRAVK